MKKTIIKGTGRYLPSRLVTNEALSQWMDTSNEWIIQRTGIEQRYWVPEAGGVGASDLGLRQRGPPPGTRGARALRHDRRRVRARGPRARGMRRVDHRRMLRHDTRVHT